MKRKKKVVRKRTRRKRVMVRKRMVMKMMKLREPQAKGQLRMMRMTTLIPRSRKLMKMTRQQIYYYFFFFLNKEENKPIKKASASSSPLGPPSLPLQPFSRSLTHTQPFLPPLPWSSSPSRVNPSPPARRCHSMTI